MATTKLPPCPPQLKQVQHYLKLASDYEVREPSIAYWARLYSLQTALKIDRKSPEAKALLTGLMDWLETFKKANPDEDAVTNDVAGQALVENEGHKLFIFADKEDRESNFNKNVVKSFYTAGIIFDVCEVFGELTEEIASQRKYAKWKATYIHNCLKKGEQPIPGPIGGEEDEELKFITNESEQPVTGFNLPPVPGAQPNNLPTPPIDRGIPPPSQGFPQHQYNYEPTPPQQPVYHTNIPQQPPAASAMPSHNPGVSLSQEKFTKAQKYCKWAISALDYEDTKSAMENLQKAMSLISTGQDS